MKEKKESWFGALLGYAGRYKSKFGLSIVLSVISVTAGIVPYFCMYRIICHFVDQTVTMKLTLGWCGGALFAYAVKVLCFAGSTGSSH